MQTKLNQIKKQFLELVLEKSKPYIRDGKNYWIKLSEREQFIVKAGGVALALMFLFLIASSMFGLEGSLKNSIRTNSIDLANARILNLKMQDLSSITANEFTSVSSEKIKGDITQLFAIKSPDAVLNDDTLIITISGAKFDLVMLFLDQLRQSYGIFPDKMKIYRGTQSGLVDFYATFHVEK